MSDILVWPMAVTKAEAARLLSCSLRTIDYLLLAGKIRGRKYRRGGHTYISVKSINKYLGDVCEALDLDFIEVLTNVEKLSREVE